MLAEKRKATTWSFLLYALIISGVLIIGVNLWLKQRFTQEAYLSDVVAEVYKLMDEEDFVRMYVEDRVRITSSAEIARLALNGGGVLSWKTEPSDEELAAILAQSIRNSLELEYPSDLVNVEILDLRADLENVEILFKVKVEKDWIYLEREEKLKMQLPLNYKLLLEKGKEARRLVEDGKTKGELDGYLFETGEDENGRFIRVISPEEKVFIAGEFRPLTLFFYA